MEENYGYEEVEVYEEDEKESIVFQEFTVKPQNNSCLKDVKTYGVSARIRLYEDTMADIDVKDMFYVTEMEQLSKKDGKLKPYIGYDFIDFSLATEDDSRSIRSEEEFEAIKGALIKRMTQCSDICVEVPCLEQKEFPIGDNDETKKKLMELFVNSLDESFREYKQQLRENIEAYIDVSNCEEVKYYLSASGELLSLEDLEDLKARNSQPKKSVIDADKRDKALESENTGTIDMLLQEAIENRKEVRPSLNSQNNDNNPDGCKID